VSPEIDPFYFPREVQEGQLTQIACTVSKGDDPVTIQWYKDEHPLTSSSKFLINSVDSKLSFLILRDVGSEHSGVYSCSAVNSAGRARVEAPLRVKGINIYLHLTHSIYGDYIEQALLNIHFFIL